MKITIVGPAWPYRGGIADFNERLAHQLQFDGEEVKIYTFTLQYPSFLFPGTTQYTSSPSPKNLTIERSLSSINPLSWVRLGLRIRKEKPDLLIFSYWMPFMAPAFGTLAHVAKNNKNTRVLALMHNFIPHEKHRGDKLLSHYIVHCLDGVVALSQSVVNDIHRFRPQLPCVFSPHPLYDNFGERVEKEEACRYLSLNPNESYFLFFGLIREYKGLDLLLNAWAKFKEYVGNEKETKTISLPKLIVAGEFYGNGEKYHELARTLGIDEEVVWKTHFIPDDEVRYYFSLADLVVQPYKTATQSGVTQIAYHFQCPMLVTSVGGLAEIVPDGKVGYVVEPDAESIALSLKHFLVEKPDFSKGLQEEKKKYSWERMTKSIFSLVEKEKNDPR